MTTDTKPLHQLTATEVAESYRNGDLTVEGYIETLLTRIENRECDTKAWVYLGARASLMNQARQLDMLPAEARGPLHGIPIGIKDVFYTEDMPTKYNSQIYTDSEVRVDAAAVSILRHAGAIILGKTATAEFAATDVGPQTKNPHDPDRTPGGSSSGSAAAVADMHIPIALGGQTGGSIIRPASFNGLYAMKPTWGAISIEGHKVLSPILDTVGFFSRSVADLQLIANVYQLEDDEPVANYEEKECRIAIIKTAQWKFAENATKTIIENVSGVLRAAGIHVSEVELPPEFDELHDYQRQIMYSDGGVTFYSECRAGMHRLSPFLIDFIQNRRGLTHKDRLHALDSVARLRPKIDEILSPFSAALTPSTPGDAPLGSKTGSPVFNTFWTALHTPVINMPGFASEVGLPVGLSIIAPRFRDQQLLQVARTLAPILEGAGGWTSKL